MVYRNVGEKQYKLKDHLGNVRVVVNDRKDLDTATDSLSAHVVSYSNYYPFGMPMPGRNFDSQEYRYGFQGQEKDSEIKGEGLSVNYKFRMYDTRLGKFLSLDPLSPEFPHNSPYAFGENRVIDGIELEGGEYLDYKESRVFISWGTARLNLKNSNPPTSSLFRNKKSGTLRYPALNSIDYGYSGVEYMSLLEQDDTMEFLKGSKPEVFRYFKNNGTYDNRYNPRLVGGNLKNTKGHIAIAAVETINWGLSWWINEQVREDYRLSAEHENVYLKFVVPAITEALNAGEKYIPMEARNDFSLSLIANTILYGEKVKGYEKLYEIGMKIYNELAEKPKIPTREQLEERMNKTVKQALEVKKDNTSVGYKKQK